MGLKVVPANQAGEERTDAPRGFAGGASLCRSPSTSGPRDVDGSRGFTNSPRALAWTRFLSALLRRPTLSAMFKQTLLRRAEKLIWQSRIEELQFLHLSQKSDREPAGQELLMRQGNVGGH